MICNLRDGTTLDRKLARVILRLLRPALALAIPLALGACVTTQGKSGAGLPFLEPFAYDTLSTFKTNKGEGSIRRLRSDGTFDLQPGRNYYGIPLHGVTRIDDVSALENGRETTVIVKGATNECAVHYGVHVIKGDAVESHRIGDCSSPLTFSKTSDGGFVAQQGQGPAALVWGYKPHKWVSGPVTLASIEKPSKPPKPSSSRRTTASTSRSQEPRKPASGSPAAHTASAPAAPRQSPNQIELPPVLEPTAKPADVTVWEIKTPAP